MKQVFPGIRPRRLGTRGHSRYCYAAMRKATKLDSPRLPNLSNKKQILNSKIDEKGESIDTADADNNEDEDLLSDEDSWKIIKKWADTMLSFSFNGISDLAKFITKNNLNSPAIINTQQMIQKKLMQREMKEKKKLANAAMKKRRKKRKKTTSTSSSATDLHNMSTNSKDDNTSMIMMKDTDGDTNSNALIDDGDEEEDEENSQLLPINLTNNEHQGTNLACDKTLIPEKINNSTILPTPVPLLSTSTLLQPLINDIKLEKNAFDDIIESSTTTSTFISGIVPAISASNSSSSNIADHEIQNIICKKVRQAQQSKGLLQQQQLLQPTQQQILITAPVVQPHHNFQHPENVAIVRKNQNNLKRHLNQQNKCTKKSKFKQPKQQVQKNLSKISTQSNDSVHPSSVNFGTMETNDPALKKDEPDFVILPRERFISICNMDKNALDDYLICEENSQEQEAELLQYFPEEAEVNKQQSSKRGESSTQAMLSTSEIDKLTDYSAVDCKIEKHSDTDDSSNDNILQLRKLLEQNISNNNNSNNLNEKQAIALNVSLSDPNQNILPVGSGSASASLAMLSQRHHSHTITTNTSIGSNNNINTNSKLRNFSSINASRKIDFEVTHSQHQIPFNSANSNETLISNDNIIQNQCPNARRKNFSFVPIEVDDTSSQILSGSNILNNNNPNLKSHNVVESPFVSPRTTPVIKKNNKMSNNLPPIHIINTIGPNHYKAEIMQAQSAPPSPSMLPNYHNNAGLNYPPIYNSQPLQQSHHHSHNIHHTHSQQTSPIMNSESRCRSVPLHSLNNYTNYSPAYNSIPHNPAPDYSDFTEAHINDILNDPTPGLQTQTIKMESSNISDLLSNNNSTNNLLNFGRTNNFSNISRSVPSTPLPMQCYNHNLSTDKISNNPFDMPKSVPNTPIAMNTNLFRYSPETSRDFLINGNSVDRGGKLSYFQNQIPFDSINVGTGNSTYAPDNMNILSDGIEGLPNLDTDQIIGSDILNNL